MRIIYGHDYYDSALAWGQDDNIVFVRERERIVSYDDLRDSPITSPLGILGIRSKKNRSVDLIGNDWKDRTGVSHVAACCRVWVAGSQWNGLKISSTDNLGGITDQFIWAWSTLVKWLENHSVDIDPSIVSRYWYAPDRTVSVNCDWFGETPCNAAVISYMTAHGITIITNVREDKRSSHSHAYRVNGDNLKDLEFYKACDAYSVFQKISQWQGGVLSGSGNPMVEITDNVVKAHKHGFDKWSFRRHPGDKK